MLVRGMRLFAIHHSAKGSPTRRDIPFLAKSGPPHDHLFVGPTGSLALSRHSCVPPFLAFSSPRDVFKLIMYSVHSRSDRATVDGIAASTSGLRKSQRYTLVSGHVVCSDEPGFKSTYHLNGEETSTRLRKSGAKSSLISWWTAFLVGGTDEGTLYGPQEGRQKKHRQPPPRLCNQMSLDDAPLIDLEIYS